LPAVIAYLIVNKKPDFFRFQTKPELAEGWSGRASTSSALVIFIRSQAFACCDYWPDLWKKPDFCG
jgi:hypothetical protein